jgi:hypothetical protein
MKKLLLVLLAMVFLVSLTACNNDGYKTSKDIDIISEAKLSDREKMFLSVSNMGYFTFDFRISEKYKWVEVWIDRYEFGKKISSNGKLLTGISESSEGIILATLTDTEDMKSNWTIAIKNSGTIVTGKYNQEYKNADLNSFTKTWQSFNTKNNIEDGNEITLASVCYKELKNGSSMSSLTDRFYKSPDENIREIIDYNLVYLLKAKFYEKDTRK